MPPTIELFAIFQSTISLQCVQYRFSFTFKHSLQLISEAETDTRMNKEKSNAMRLQYRVVQKQLRKEEPPPHRTEYTAGLYL